MRSKYVIGNWKMNLSVKEATDLVNKIVKNNSNINKGNIVVAPQFLLIPSVGSIISKSNIKLSAQNCSTQSHGAYTGESSSKLIKEVGCQYCIVGHSERRKLFFEADDVIGDKTKLLLENDLLPIVCVGETLNERQGNHHWDVLSTQLTAIYRLLSSNMVGNIIIAYEPVWAIGTGKTAKSNQVEEVHLFIRKWLSKTISTKIAQSTSILYGGSVKPENVNSLNQLEDIDGFLVGGASLKFEDFQQIINLTL